MANYKLVIKPSAARELDRIPQKKLIKITEKIKLLATEPRPSGCRKLSGEERYRLRQGNYRIVYEIHDSDNLVRIVKIGHRRDVYRK